MSDPSHRTCPRCGKEYVPGEYLWHRVTPAHRASLAGARSLAYAERVEQRWMTRNERRDGMAALHADGWTLRAIGEKYGVSGQFVLHELKAFGRHIPRSPGRKPATCFIDGEAVKRGKWLEHRLSSSHQAALAQVVAASQEIVRRNHG